MRLHHSITAIIVGLIGLVLASARGDETPTPTGVVRMRIVQPDGSPLVHGRAAISAVGNSATIAVVTDAQGVAQFSWLGNAQFRVAVKGVGYGMTGELPINPGQTVTADLPPLVRYANVSGEYPAARGGVIRFGALYGDGSVDATVNAKGQFSAELPADQYYVYALLHGTRIAKLPGLVLRPGQTVADVRLKAMSNTEQEMYKSHSFVERRVTPGESASWVHGTVRDVAGNPVSGATIKAYAALEGGMRMEFKSEVAETDEKGEYDIRGAIEMGGQALVVVTNEKTPPECFQVTLPGTGFEEVGNKPPVAGPLPSGPKIDVTLADRSGTLRVIAMQAGAPAAGKAGEILRQGMNLPDHFGGMEMGLLDESYDPDIFPPVTTDAKGVAVFDYLPPGRYRVRVFGTAQVPRDYFDLRRNVPLLTADGIAVNLGQTAVQTMALPDAAARGPVYSPSAIARSWAESEALADGPTTVVQGEPDTVTVDLLDTDGRPARGSAEIGIWKYVPSAFGSTDEHGRVRFDHVKLWQNGNGIDQVNADFAGDRQIELPWFNEEPLPSDEELTGDVFVPPASAPVESNTALHVTLRAQPAGFVRGVLHPPPGHSASEYQVLLPWSDTEHGAVVDYQPTGEFVAGPFAPGKYEMLAGATFQKFPPAALALHEPFTIDAGKVTRMDVTLPPHSILDWASERVEKLISGHVYLSDGKRPAYGAALIYLVPGRSDPHFFGSTDITGEIRAFGDGYSAGIEPPDPPDSPVDPVIVACIPGITGATVINAPDSVGKPMSIVLPPPISRSGMLTFAGKPLGGQTGEFRVFAAYQGNGKLDECLSVWATPQPDGSFVLAGLTPGTYRVQAAMNGLWLSNSVETVVNDKPPSAIHLDLPGPGSDAAIHCTSADGKPLAGMCVVVDHPAGPLVRWNWPAFFISDGGGDISIPTLEAGRHTARIIDGTATTDFIVPPLPAATPVKVRLTER
jgi:hypothetical protein